MALSDIEEANGYWLGPLTKLDIAGVKSSDFCLMSRIWAWSFRTVVLWLTTSSNHDMWISLTVLHEQRKICKISNKLKSFYRVNYNELWVFKCFFEYQMAQYTVINDKKILTRLMFSIAILWLIQSNRAKIN